MGALALIFGDVPVGAGRDVYAVHKPAEGRRALGVAAVAGSAPARDIGEREVYLRVLPGELHSGRGSRLGGRHQLRADFHDPLLHEGADPKVNAVLIAMTVHTGQWKCIRRVDSRNLPRR